MVIERPGDARGHVRMDWLDSRHTFSFGQYHDPAWMGFGPLRVINDDRVAPGAGFPTHGHANMEIFSYVLEGALAHRDDAGGGDVLRPGEFQWMGAGHGIAHSEFNASDTEPVHFLQVWIQPDRVNAAPGWEKRAFPPADRTGRWALFASPDGARGSIAIRQQAGVHGTLLPDGASVEFECLSTRRYWLHVATGQVQVDGRTLRAGDALGFAGEGVTLTVRGAGDGLADVLVFDLPGEPRR